MLKILFTFSLLVSTFLLSAQTDFRPGYIIKKSGDTIYGDIDYRGDILMSSVCKFKDANQNIIKYSPDDILGYRFIKDKYYVSREINSKKVFLEYLIKGKINIYYMRDDARDHYFIEKQNQKLLELPYEEGTRYIDNKEVFYESKQHIGLLIFYMKDAPELRSQIESIGEPNRENLIKLAEGYNNAICDEKCIIYQKKLPSFKIYPEIITGTIKYYNVGGLNDKFYFHPGIIVHIWMPNSNEKLYFRTGVLLSQLELKDEKINYYKIPVQFEYIYPKGFLRPRIAYGINFYIPSSYQSVSLNFGANIKLTENFFLSTTSDIEFNPTLLIVPKSILSYSINLGLFFKFH